MVCNVHHDFLQFKVEQSTDNLAIKNKKRF